MVINKAKSLYLRSPLAPNTKHCDDCTGSDRPIGHQERSSLECEFKG
ncbi:hypothetical protein [Microcoleus sp.]